MADNILARKTVRHRDGSITVWVKQRISLDEVARRFAIWVRMLPVMTYELPKHITKDLIKEKHGMMTYTRLRITDTKTGKTAIATKTNLGDYFRTGIETLDENGATFWEDESKPNYWVLADTFAI